jgi:hypothetical protein
MHGLASMQAVTCVKAERASKWERRKPTRPECKSEGTTRVSFLCRPKEKLVGCALHRPLCRPLCSPLRVLKGLCHGCDHDFESLLRRTAQLMVMRMLSSACLCRNNAATWPDLPMGGSSSTLCLLPVPLCLTCLEFSELLRRDDLCNLPRRLLVDLTELVRLLFRVEGIVGTYRTDLRLGLGLNLPPLVHHAGRNASCPPTGTLARRTTSTGPRRSRLWLREFGGSLGSSLGRGGRWGALLKRGCRSVLRRLGERRKR